MTDVFEQATADIVSAIATAGETVSASYTPVGPSGASQASISLDVVRTDNVEAVSESGHVLHLGTVFDILRSDVDHPAKGDTIRIGTTEWTVQEVVERDQYLTRVATR